MKKTLYSLIIAAAVLAAFAFGCSGGSVDPESSVPSLDQALQIHGLTGSTPEIEILEGITFEFYPGAAGEKVIVYENADSCLVLEISPAGEILSHSGMAKGMWDCISRNAKICRQLYPDDSVPGATEAYDRCYTKGWMSCVVAYSVMSWFVDAA